MSRKMIDLVNKRFGMLVVTGLKAISDQGKKGQGSKTLWNCICDCGKTTIGNTSALLAGQKKSCGCMRTVGRTGTKNIKWAGGRKQKKDGYIVIRAYDYPDSEKSVSVHEHVYVMAKHLGRALAKGESVHHKNGVRNDNRLENLELWSSYQPPGQRIEDKVIYAIEILKMYKPELLK